MKEQHNSIKKKTISGVFFSIIGQFLKTIVQFVTTAFLARLLSPEDFGLVALTGVVTGFILIFKDLGLSMASVQQAKITQDQVSNLFWINLFFSILLSILILLLSPVVAWFFNDDRLILITSISGTSIVLGGLTVQYQALLRRNMKFKTLSIIDVISRLLASIIVIFWAFKYNSYWSLVFLTILTSFFYALFVILSLDWKPTWIKRGVGTMSMLNFGKDMTHYSIVNYFARNADNLIIGRVSGAIELGYYSRAYSLMLLPIGQLVAPLTGVIIPALSRFQNNPSEFNSIYQKTVYLLSYLIFPLISSMFLLSDEIIDVFLGVQWEESKQIFKILCLAGFWQPIMSTTGWVLTSLNQTKRIVLWGYINSSMLILIFFVGSIWGALGVAYSYAIFMWIIVLPNIIFSLKLSPVNYLDVIKLLKEPFFINLIYVLISLFLLSLNNTSYIYTRIGIQLIFGLIYWGAVFTFNQNIRTQITKIKYLNKQ